MRKTYIHVHINCEMMVRP